MKNNLKNFASKLRDGGEKLKASLRKYEDELERRNKIKPPPVLPVNIPVSAEVEPKSLLISSPAPAPPPPPPEPQQAPNTHSVDSVQHMISNGDKKNDASNISFPNRGLAVNKPLFSSGSQHGVATSVPTADANINDTWIDEMMQNILNEVVTLATESTGRKPSASGNDDRPPVTFSKGSSGVFVQQNQELDIELKTDSEIKETIARLKRNLVAFGHKLHDKGEKIKESILRYEHELQRRKKIKAGVLPVNIPVSAQVNPTSQLLSPAPAEPAPAPASPQECPQSTVTHLVDSVKQMVSDDGNKGGDSNLPSRDHVAGNKPSPFSGSQYGVGVAANGSTVNADKHDSLTDEKMLKIVHELVTVGIAHTEVGKAAEVCYKDPVKAKVLFALPAPPAYFATNMNHDIVVDDKFEVTVLCLVPMLLDKVPLSMAHKVNVELPLIVPDSLYGDKLEEGRIKIWRVVDDLIAFSGENSVARYMSFFLDQKIAESRRFVTLMHEESNIIMACIAQMTALVAELQAMENEDEVYNALLAAKDAKRGEESKLLALTELIVEALEDIHTLELDLEILGGDDNGV
nr:peptidase C48, SUMO/sentrin/Ubl1 [Tanacetum cinerariifolium]